MDQGYNIIIFPTGTRTLADEQIKIHKGAALIAIDNNKDIIPIKIKTDFPFLAKHKNPLHTPIEPVNYFFELMPIIKLNEFEDIANDEIKLRKHISEKIKNSIN